MPIDLTSLSPSQLQSLIENASSQIHHARASQVQDIRAKIDDLLSKSGLSIDDVYPARGKGRGKAAKGSKGSSVAPKYRNPSDPSQTWSGRGRQPLWLAAALKKRGSSIEQFLIKGASIKRTAKKATRKKVRA